MRKSIALLSLNVQSRQLPSSLHSRIGPKEGSTSSLMPTRIVNDIETMTAHLLYEERHLTRKESKLTARLRVLAHYETLWGKLSSSDSPRTGLSWNSFQYNMTIGNPWNQSELWKSMTTTGGSAKFPNMP